VIQRSSELAIDDGLRGQDRIIAICKALGADSYVNPPGGRQLYDADAFRSAGIDLRFLSPWQGKGSSILPDLLCHDPQVVADDIVAGL
jgi:hypothetical protein